MSNTKCKIAKNKVDEILEEHRPSYPLEIAELSTALNITIELVDRDRILEVTRAYRKSNEGKDAVINTQDSLNGNESILGFTDIDAHKIYINNNQQYIPRLRFTIVHELGHFMLQHEKSKLRQVLTLGTTSFNTSQKEEIDANYFASYLLAPDVEIKKRLDYIELMDSSSEIIEQFSKMFGMSKQAMKYRFKIFREENKGVLEHYDISGYLIDLLDDNGHIGYKLKPLPKT